MNLGFICPTCGCSLIRLGIDINKASTTTYNNEAYYFCCNGCKEIFLKDPEKYINEIKDKFVCPVCLGEKNKSEGVVIEYEGREVFVCRCPGCVAAFKKDPEFYINRLITGVTMS